MTQQRSKVAPLLLLAMLASCAPKVTQAAKVQGPDFSGKTAPVGKASATRAGTCGSYAVHFEEVGLKVLPIPLTEGGLWSPLILEQTETGGAGVPEAYARFISKNNGANTPNLNILVHCQQLSSSMAQLEVSTVGPLPPEQLKSVSERFLVALP